MSRLTTVTLSIGLLLAAEVLSAQRVKQLGHAIVEFRSSDVKVVAAYEYSRRNHTGEWLLVELAAQAKGRIAIERAQIHLLTADERRIALASQEEFLEGYQMLNGLLQNASIWRRPLNSYFNVRLQPTIRFFSNPGKTVQDSFVTNPDEVASGDLFFKSAGAGWASGTYRLVMSHPDARAELPIELDRNQLPTTNSQLPTPVRCLGVGSWALGVDSEVLLGGGLREIRLRRGLVLDRRDLVRVDPHHQVVDVIVDLREPVARARRDHDDVPWFEVQGHAVADL
jgi:hypothetical protein